MLLHDTSPGSVELREESFVLGTYARTSFHPRWGKGAKLFDAEGRAYWDLLGGLAVNILGHQHPAITRTIREQSRALVHVSNLYFHPAQGLLAEHLVRLARMDKAFFCNSGTEANEAAIKFARLRTPGRHRIVSLHRSFHGRSAGSLSVTGNQGYREPFAPLLPGVTFIEPDDAGALESAVDETTSAIILEPILGEGGVVPLAAEFLAAARRAADRHDAVLIFDEIQCGFGRTGTFFAFEQSGVEPDIVTLAKPLGGGLPLGAVIVNEHVARVVRPGHHGTTFGGNPIACALGLAVLSEIARAALLSRTREVGSWFGAMLRDLAAVTPAIVDVRGAGLMWGIELDRKASPVTKALLERGFVVGTAGENVLRLLPPYIVPKKALREFAEALDAILANQEQEGRSPIDQDARSASLNHKSGGRDE